jgi:protein-S-isoprenylcysteine O-methyltransferase Ste14
VTYKVPTPIYAFLFAFGSGCFLATGHYVPGVILGVLAIVLMVLWQFAERRGDDDRHEIW